MGGLGSGKTTDRSTAFDLAELVDALLARLERAYYEPTILADREWMAEQRMKLRLYQDRLKERTMRERQR